MPRFLIERSLPGAGDLTQPEVQAIAQMSCSVLRSMDPGIQWIESFVTPNKIYCLYLAPNAELIWEHARLCGFPIDSVELIQKTVGPPQGSGSAGGVAPLPADLTC